ncbi:MAG: hypothetical protein ACPG42_06830 [Alphaproteobacteria bacterium]|jgi:hypothetical protein
MIQNVTLVSTLTDDTARRLVSQSFGCVIDLRTSIGSQAGRPIEEPILKALMAGFIDYRQLPIDLHSETGRGLGEALVLIFATLKPLALVVDDVESWRDELAFVGVRTAGLASDPVVQLDVAA